MKTVIIFASKHGTTEKVANIIAGKLQNEEVKLFRLQHPKRLTLQLREADRIILGSPVYGGRIQKIMTRFCQLHSEELQKKELGLFVCGMQPTEEQRYEEMQRAYQPVLTGHARALGFMGGEFLFHKMNFLERWVVKKVAKTTYSISQLDEPAIDKFVNDLSR
jgi:menaquinone-dependent protoporphyrinogen oxidase